MTRSITIHIRLFLFFFLQRASSSTTNSYRSLPLTVCHSFSHHLSFMPFVLRISALLFTSIPLPSFALSLLRLFIAHHHSPAPSLWVTGEVTTAMFLSLSVCLHHLTRDHLSRPYLWCVEWGERKKQQVTPEQQQAAGRSKGSDVWTKWSELRREEEKWSHIKKEGWRRTEWLVKKKAGRCWIEPVYTWQCFSRVCVHFCV